VSCSLHDVAGYEADGIPSVLVASEEFETAVETQRESLGTMPTVVYVPHPIQSRSDEEMESLADSYFEAILGGLLEK
jgi:alkanesulfonate monooxygenase SsuD/methylene tetrahydromethanopterin reductase-like flavin-dependent oxidoreductase (luciferase family)